MSITIHLRADGVSLLLHTDGGLPEARYWGADLGELTATDVGTQLERTAFTAELNNVQAQLRIALLPEGRTGWQGTPGLVGSRKGRGWTPDWRLVAALIDGAEAAEGPPPLAPARSSSGWWQTTPGSPSPSPSSWAPKASSGRAPR